MEPATKPNNPQMNLKRLALQFIILFGVISALGDITYEGARSVYGPYLANLGASAAIVGLVSGVGEFFGYILRLAAGYFVDRTQKYWLITIIGYALLISVPLLAIAGHWKIAALFIILERIGKAIRSPGKDAMLSRATKQIGTGFGFGIHEALDQIGGIIGPLLFTAALAATGAYKLGFSMMWIPALLTIIIILLVKAKFPEPRKMFEDGTGITTQTKDFKRSPKAFPRFFWFYTLFTFISVLGFANFPIIAYHFIAQKVIPEVFIPALYALAMGIDALVAVIIGRTYDHIGFISLVSIPILTLPIAFWGFSQSLFLVVLAVILWGAVLGIHETIMRAAIADIIPSEHRGKAYGIFYTLYGSAMLIGSATMGLLYEIDIAYIVAFIVIIQISAFLSFGLFYKNLNNMK